MKINRISDVFVVYDNSSREVYCVAESQEVAKQIIIEDFDEESRADLEIVPTQFWGK